MVHYSKVTRAVAAYIDREILPKAYPHIVNNPWVKILGLVDGENIDVETMIAVLRELARKRPITIDLPAGIQLRLTEDDVEALHRHIMA